jgi:3-dehydroquinate dehydratase II
MAVIGVIHGPNLNMLGTREPDRYGHITLEALNTQLERKATELGHRLVSSQHNSESGMIDAIHQSIEQPIDFMIINPAAFTHTSIALRDALLAVAIPFIEVHISNIYQREAFRRQSYLADIAQGVIVGFGIHGYELALMGSIHYLS